MNYRTIINSLETLGAPCLIFICAVSTSNAAEIFRIGKPDASAAEFKIFRNLADPRYTFQKSQLQKTDDCRAFRDIDDIRGFCSKPFEFTVGESHEKDFPFIHPIGGCWWKAHLKGIVINFDAPENTPEELYFRVGISDMSDMGPIDLEVFLNGESIGVKTGVNTGVGFGGTLAYKPTATGIPHSVSFKFDSSKLKKGKNRIEIRPKARSPRPSWFAYDYVELSDSPEAPKIPDCRDEILKNAVRAAGTAKVVFSTRGEGRDYHWYSNIGKTCWVKTGVAQIDARFDCEMFSRLGGKLCVYDLVTGELKNLVDDPDGCVRDHTLSFDGKKILFSYRKGKSGSFRLYEIGADGKGLKKLPIGAEGTDDIEPAYLPNGDIVFASSRLGKTVQCFFMPVTDIHRWYRSENKIAVLSQNPDVDSTPNVLPDGRIIYMRWDYNHRNQLAFHHLWTMNPDGSGDAVYFGNNNPGHLFISPAPIPDENGVVFTLSRGHSGRDHFGEVAKLVQPVDPDDPYCLQFVSGDISAKFNRPQPLGNGYTMATDGRNIAIFNADGQYKTVSGIPEWIFASDKTVRMSVVGWKNGKDKVPKECRVIMQGAMPLKAKPKPAARPDMADLDAKTAAVFLQDVYHGRNMAGVKRGSIDRLLVLQVLPTPAHYNGGSNQLNRLGGFALERILGTVPVEEDGSASFEVPAHRAIAFVALDKQGRAVKRMQSFVAFAPGTNTSCIGCHEMRAEAPIPKMGRPRSYGKISKITPFRGESPIDYRRQIQPLLDKYCLECHNSSKPTAGIILDGDLGANFIHSYIALDERGQMTTGRNEFGNMPPYSFGSGSSKILEKFRKGHCGKDASDADLELLMRWLDTGAMQIGAYAALNTGFLHSYLQGGVVRLEDENPENAAAYAAVENACGKCHSGEAQIPRRVFEPKQNYGETVFDYRSAFESACVEKIKYKTPDGKVGESKILADLLYNFSAPEKSLALTIPLARERGGCAGEGAHPVVFADTGNPDYRAILGAVRAASELLKNKSPFCGTPDFRPTPGYIKKLRDLKILPPDFPLDGKIDAFKADALYFDWLDKNSVIEAVKNPDKSPET